MKIKNITIKDFKRFTNLQIDEIPETAKLVVLVGPNGAGKSSVFEAFNALSSLALQQTTADLDYHIKQGSTVGPEILRILDRQPAGEMQAQWQVLKNNISINFHDYEISNWNDRKNEDALRAFYIRTSYRNEADFKISSLGSSNHPLDDSNRPHYLISPDSRVSDNYRHVVADAIHEIFFR